ncbi:benzoate 1,2-dioxygenase electron transfer component BenC [Kribbia dieselivorans]|uniref:benzoate 1,2-dioxygenase electron transfer component BenC n=1 Tax=Kribbia dieselivorans TaxID=331526 RepID=UPI00083948AC|nr:benzoate 1,2-dioxygenase electron transfer component BenC [Kribbia dieselivorans]
MTYQVALSFEDGVTKFIQCQDGQTVADASYRARINIPLDCRDGACGTCKAMCESGDYDHGPYVDDALSPDEAAEGYVLPCQLMPRGDLVLQIASTSAVAKTQAATFEATITEVQRLSPTTMAFTLEVAGRSELAFLPGQYVNIHVPGTDQSRSYSFSSDPEDEHVSFLVKLTPGGVMSTWLAEQAAVGDTVRFTGPNGSFFLRDTDRPALLLAGGTGLAPILSILRRLRATGSRRSVHLIYGVSSDADLVELDTLAELAATLPGFSFDHVVSDPNSTARNKGYVMSLIGPEHLHDGDVAIYLCGPPVMVEAVRADLKARDLEPTGFYYEKFALAGTPDTDPAVSTRAEAVVVDSTPAGWANPGDPQARSLAGQGILPAVGTGPSMPLDPEEGLPSGDPQARGIAGQEMLPPLPVVAPISGEVAPDGYEIGEEHPAVGASDALFQARTALEMGVLELVLGRLSSQQIAGYRLLAEATVPYVEGDRFVDAAAYTEVNAAFHEYPFSLSGNEHLLEAYRSLGVKGHMETTLSRATWCHPQCTQDHLDIVDAMEVGDLDRARQLVRDHGERSMVTTRRAMAEEDARRLPAWVTPRRFEGQVVIVTGAAQGIGERVARRIHAEGGHLVLADRSPVVREVAAELSAAGTEVAVVEADLEQWEGAESVVAQAIALHGRVDVAVHNVGGAIRFTPLQEFSPHQITAEINRSLYPTLWGCRAVLPQMIEQGGGTIVNVSSIATGGIHRVPYAAAKGGVNAITRSLAVEAAEHGVRVVAAAPGGTEAPPRRIPRGPGPEGEQEEEWYQAHIDQTLDSSLLKRYGTLDEQAAAICFLASREAAYITGTVVPVGGGDLG